MARRERGLDRSRWSYGVVAPVPWVMLLAIALRLPASSCQVALGDHRADIGCRHRGRFSMTIPNVAIAGSSRKPLPAPSRSPSVFSELILIIGGFYVLPGGGARTPLVVEQKALFKVSAPLSSDVSSCLPPSLSERMSSLRPQSRCLSCSYSVPIM